MRLWAPALLLCATLAVAAGMPQHPLASLPHAFPEGEQTPANTRFPPRGLSDTALSEFMAGVLDITQAGDDDSSVPHLQAPSDGFVSVGFEDLARAVVTNTDDLHPALQGVWVWDGHPKFGQLAFTLLAGQQPFKGSQGGSPATGYAYVSATRAGSVAVPDTPQNRTALAFFHRYSLEMAFPAFNTSVEPAQDAGSWISTAMAFPYNLFPLPAALAEGWDWHEAVKWSPDHSHDAAKCFCSVYYRGPDRLSRNNFGRHAYDGFRVLDGLGRPTRFYSEFAARLRDQKFVLISGKSQLSNTLFSSPPSHPSMKGFTGYSFKAKHIYKNDKGEVERTGSGKIATKYGGLRAPFHLYAFVQSAVRDAAGISTTHTFIGVNNFVLNKVDRYLIVEGPSSASCVTYPDKNPPGLIDPILLMDQRYELKGATPDGPLYEYNWNLPGNLHQKAEMRTLPDGSQPQEVNVTITRMDQSVEGRYEFVYFDRQNDVTSDIFEYYMRFECTAARNFTAPAVCFDSWLALQYECP